MTTVKTAAAPPVAMPSLGTAAGERDTRARVARLILEHGPVTASNLGERMGLTPAAVRRHLDALLADGMIETARRARPQAHRGRGRPAKWFVITDAGRNAFVHAYDDLATSALRFLAETAGAEAVAEFARRQISDLERRYRPVVRGAPLNQRVGLLAEVLSADGYAASASEAPGGAVTGPLAGQQLCQQHCPVAHVAAEFPQLCEAETEAFGRLLHTPVQRLATIAHGDGVCTTHVSANSLLNDGRPVEPGQADDAGSGEAQTGEAQTGEAQTGEAQYDDVLTDMDLDEESGRTPL